MRWSAIHRRRSSNVFELSKSHLRTVESGCRTETRVMPSCTPSDTDARFSCVRGRPWAFRRSSLSFSISCKICCLSRRLFSRSSCCMATYRLRSGSAASRCLSIAALLSSFSLRSITGSYNWLGFRIWGDTVLGFVSGESRSTGRKLGLNLCSTFNGSEGGGQEGLKFMWGGRLPE